MGLWATSTQTWFSFGKRLGPWSDPVRQTEGMEGSSVLLLVQFFIERFVREVVKREATSFRPSVGLKEAIHGSKWKIKLCVTSLSPSRALHSKPHPRMHWHVTSALFQLVVSMQHSAEFAEKPTTRRRPSCIVCASAGQQISLQQRTNESFQDFSS